MEHPPRVAIPSFLPEVVRPLVSSFYNLIEKAAAELHACFVKRNSLLQEHDSTICQVELLVYGPLQE